MKAKLITLIISLAMSISSLSASVYTWSIHNLTFEVPDGGEVTYNSPSRFEIMWYDMAVIIQLYNKQGATDNVVKADLVRRANDFNMFDTSIGKLKVKGFKCTTLNGSMPDGSQTLLADLISNDKDIFASVTINYLLGNMDLAEDIVKSFTIGTQVNKEEKKQKIQSEEDAKAQDEKARQKNSENKNKKKKKVYQTFHI